MNKRKKYEVLSFNNKYPSGEDSITIIIFAMELYTWFASDEDAV